MLQKIKLSLFIKISTFILLILCIIDKPLDENCYFHRKLDIRNYRLLGKYKQDKDSTNVCLNEHSSNNKRNQKRDISNNKNDAYIKYKQSIKDLLNKEQYYTEIVDHNSSMFDGKHFHFQRRWIKKKDYDEFLGKNRKICDIALKKIKFKSYGFVVVLFFIFFLLGIGIPGLYGIESLNVSWNDIKSLDIWKYFKEPIENMVPDVIKPYINIISFSVLMIILSFILIVVIYKTLRNNEKYQQIKLMRE
ncbi:fam-m protein [Plasmodium malariae]|uniref:Fam-m protein n=1 Tax=Plasmodium malariae TaxID=5858 RepID=A0A1D3PB64_PLAMA|nr:fam-m protein [Plasmodium malariae]SCN12539.1 fam-m protein [Plasmodium malariae]